MNIKEVCRTCLRAGGLQCSLFDSSLTKFELAHSAVIDLLKTFAKIDISNHDELSHKICSHCIEEIERIHVFKLSCERSEIILRELLNDRRKNKMSENCHMNQGNETECNFQTPSLIFPIISPLQIENIECLDVLSECEKIDNNLEGSGIFTLTGLDSTTVDTFYTQLDQGSLPIEQCLEFEADKDVTMEIDSIDNCEIDYQLINLKDNSQLPIDDANSDETDTAASDSIDQTRTDIFECSDCYYECISLEELERHTIDNHIKGRFCMICNKEFECSTSQHCSEQHLNASTPQKAAIHYATEYQCSVCFKNFEKKSTLIVHARSHSKKRQFNCEICLRTFRDKCDLKYHMRIEHDTILPDFQCKICSKILGNKSSLSRHVRSHTKEKPFKCGTCGKSFRDKSGFTYHVRVKHAPKIDFRCEICSKVFGTKTHLIRHGRSHTKEKPFKCELCSKFFRDKGSLNYHVKVKHTVESSAADKNNMRCEICSRVFYRKSHLVRHVRSHTCERPYKCESCSCAFQDKSSLNYHVKVKHVPTVAK